MLVQQQDVPVRQGRPQCLVPGIHPGRHRYPNAVSRITHDEIDLAERLPIQAVVQRPNLAVARHEFEAIGAEVGNENVSSLGKGETVRQRAEEQALLTVHPQIEVIIRRLGDERLRPVWVDPHDAASRVGRPQGTVAFR